MTERHFLNTHFFSRRARLAGMALGLALFGWGGVLPVAALGLLLFGVCAFPQPALGLLFVIVTVPLYLIPASISGVRAGSFVVPLHEAALLTTCAAALARWLWQRRTRPHAPPTEPRMAIAMLRQNAPALLVLVSGVLGLLLAIQRGPALRELRWIIIEPLLFYGLLKLQLAQTRPDQGLSAAAFKRWLLAAFVLGGALAGLLGLLQYIGVDLVPWLGAKQCFAPNGTVCPNIVEDGGLRRVLSVYGHPNNFGLYLGRVWPLAAALAVDGGWGWSDGSSTQLKTQNSKLKTQNWLWALGALLCLGGIVVSFSRGAWLGAVAALAVLLLGWTQGRFQRAAALRSALGIGALLLVLVGLALTLRGDVTGGSTPVRLLLWREALGYIRLHPLGIGLDQFGYYHDPANGRSLIDPALVDTSERYAAHPHNLLLDLWLRLGPLGVVAFGWLLLRFFQSGIRQLADPVVLGALAAMTAALLHGLVDSFYAVPDLALSFWLLIVLVECSKLQATREAARAALATPLA